MYTETGDLKHMEGTIREMKEKGLKPKVAQYNTILHAYSRQDRETKVLGTFMVSCDGGVGLILEGNEGVKGPSR